jgi:hypothetical protein
MFRCERCGEVTPSRVSCRKVVTQTRTLEKPEGGTRTEIVKETMCCACCASDLGVTVPDQERAEMRTFTYHRKHPPAENTA